MNAPPSEPNTSADLAARFAALESMFPSSVAELLGEIDALIAEAEACDDLQLCWRCVLLKGNSLLYFGRMDETVALLDSHEAGIRASGNSRVMAGYLNLRSVIADRRSANDEAIRILQEAMEYARDLEEVPVQANITANMGLNFAYLGEYGSALKLLEESLTMWQRAGDSRGVIPTLINLGMTCDKAAQTDLAIRYFDEALAKSRKIGDARRCIISLVNLAAIHARNGDFATSASMAAEAISLASNQGDSSLLAHSLAATVPALSARGDYGAAREALEKALKIYEDAKLERGVIVTALDLAELPTTPHHEARELSLRAVKIAQAANLHGDEARARLCLAKLAKADGDWHEALIETEAARCLERKLYDEETLKRTQAVRVRRVVEDLNLELARERREHDEIARLLNEVSEQRSIAEEASRQKSALLGIAAHDLRNGLSGIIGCLEVATDLLNNEGPDEEVREMIDLARQAADDVFAMLLRLIDHAAIERGELSSHPEPIRLLGSLTKLLSDWTHSLTAKKQAVNLQCADGGIQIFVDPKRWTQIFSNLFSNAVKYSPVGERIDLVVLMPQLDRVRIEFRDRGPGISEADQGQMFRPFQTLSAQPTGGELATGLGLHIVKGLVESQGGRIGYEAREGGGSVFWVELGTVVLAPAE